jgi:putative CocE/NonD family hydrolase
MLSAQPAPAGSAADRYERAEFMIPMRDGVRLHTVVWSPPSATGPLPILLERTPYDAERGCRRALDRATALTTEPYLFVCQDIRGKFRSEGAFVMIRPPSPAGDATSDETTDAWDTIDWLVRELPGTNGRVGMRGVSYGGWTTMMALLDPHPALKAASPQASPDDMFQGDDFFHNGAFRLSYGFEYVASIDGRTSTPFAFDRVDTFDWFLRLGGLGNVETQHFRGTRPMWRDFTAHHVFDEFWRRRKVSTHLTRPVTVPTLTVAGWWDQEDFYGPLTLYDQLESLDPNGLNYLVVGPWNHGGWSGGTGASLGPIQFGSETAVFFRDSVEAPWFAYWLKDKGRLDLPEALTFRVGSNTWQRHSTWPPRDGVRRRALHFGPRSALSWTAPADANAADANAADAEAADAEAADRFVSDPARPVPYRARPIFPLYGGSPPSTWPIWQVDDQRHSHLRPDVLHYETEPLTEDVTISGRVVANLFGSTTGTDADWVVKLIDVYPDPVPEAPAMGGYQLMVLGDVVRARFRGGIERAEPVPAGEVVPYRVPLNAIDYTFRKGHRIMVQVQSSWFPLIDRNPQTFVPNIFEATDGDYRAATHTIHRSARHPSHVELPVVVR